MRRDLIRLHFSYAMFGFLVPGLASIVLPLLVVDAGHRPFRVGSVVAAQNWGVLLAPVWGWYAGRFQTYRIVLVIGLLCLGSGFGVFSMARGLPAMFGASLLIGIGTGACSTAASLLIVETSTPGSLGRRIGQLQFWGATGTVLGFTAASRLVPVSATILGAVMVVPAIAAGALWLPSQPFLASRWKKTQVTSLGHGDRVDLHSKRRGLLLFALFLTTWSLFSLAVSAFSALFPITMFRAYGLNVRVSVDTIAIATMISLPFYGVAGRLISDFGAMRVFSAGIFSRLFCLTILSTLTIVGSKAVFPVLLLVGLFQIVWPLLGVAASELAALLAPRMEGTAIGLFNATGAFSSGAGATLSGAVADLSGYRSISMWAAGIALIAFLLSVTLMKFLYSRKQMN